MERKEEARLWERDTERESERKVSSKADMAVFDIHNLAFSSSEHKSKQHIVLLKFNNAIPERTRESCFVEVELPVLSAQVIQKRDFRV